MIAHETGSAGETECDTTKPTGQARRKLDTSRAERGFGFCERTPIRDGIKQTVAWYRASAPEPAIG